MASNLVQIEKFESGDFEEFLDNFEISSLANEWVEESSYDRNLFEGRSTSSLQNINHRRKKILRYCKGKLLSAFKPEDITFTSLSEFHGRTIFPGERPQNYLFELKRLLNKAFPEMAEEAKEQLLFEQFIRGLPKAIYENIRTSPDIKTSDAAMKRTQILIRLESDLADNHRDNVAIVKQKQDRTEEEEGKTLVTKSALEEAVKSLQNQLSLIDTSGEEKFVCAVRGDYRSRRSYGFERK